MHRKRPSRPSAPKKEEPRKENGFIAVAAGDGLADIFRDLGVDYVIEGGQTMNPSTDDVLSAIEQVNADNIFVLPNNGNIILAANQAKNLTEDKEVYVSSVQKYSAGNCCNDQFCQWKICCRKCRIYGRRDAIDQIRSGYVCGS